MSYETSFHFSAQVRLHAAHEFSAALQGKRLGRTSWLQLSGVAASSQPTLGESPDSLHLKSLSQPRLGLIVGKKIASKATTRNAIKRVLRESFRHHRPFLPTCDYVIRVHSRIPTLSLRQLKREVRQQADTLWAKLLDKPN